MAISEAQKRICAKYNSVYFESPDYLKVGISPNLKGSKIFPINGLRHLPHGDTTGWYLWGGEEYSDDPDFFVPLHIAHLEDWNPIILKYLALSPGHRFLIGENGYEDVWFDDTLLEVD